MPALDTRAAEAITRTVEDVSRRGPATTARVADHLDIPAPDARALLQDAEARGLLVATENGWGVIPGRREGA